MNASKEFQERIGRIEGLVHKLDSSADPALRRDARELMEAVMELHGAALHRILEIVGDAGDGAALLIESLATDPLIGSVLVLYGLHPEEFETRVRRAIDKLRAPLRTEGAHIEGLDIRGSNIRLRIAGADSSLEEMVREALLEAAPDATEVVITVGIGGGGGVSARPGFVPLTGIRAADGSPAIHS